VALIGIDDIEMGNLTGIELTTKLAGFILAIIALS